MSRVMEDAMIVARVQFHDQVVEDARRRLMVTSDVVEGLHCVDVIERHEREADKWLDRYVG